MTNLVPLPDFENIQTISIILASQDSWRGHSPRDICDSIALVPIDYPTCLEKYIEEHGMYGCPVRPLAYKEMILDIGLRSKTPRDTDKELAQKLLWHTDAPDTFPQIERACYELIDVLAQKQADAQRVEERILMRAVIEFVTDAQHALKVSSGRRLRYLPGDVTAKTAGCHQLVTECRARLGLTPTDPT